MALNGDDEDFEWEPPTEAEMKVIQARRERQDKISKLMGEYLLKGYKMLGECCDLCGTILLQNKQQKNYCVSCQELDSDVDKDNPALNAQAALSQVRERQLAALPPAQAAPLNSMEAPAPVAVSPGPCAPPVSPPSTAIQNMLQEAEEAVLTKLRWATNQLQSSASVETSIQLCSLITSCASSLRSLKDITSHFD